MYQIDGPTSSGGLFTGGNPAVPTPPTAVTPDWLNAVQQEIVTVILQAGMPLAKGNNGQLYAAIEALIASGGTALASDAETVAGALANKATTPHGVAAALAQRIVALIGGAPSSLSTLGGLATAVNNDPAFSFTVATAIAARAIAARQISTSGLATGGGDLTNDRTINVQAAAFSDYVAGTRGDMALTPAALAGGAGTNSKGAWTTLPGGVLMQWGSITVLPSGSSSAAGSVVFPIAFPSKCESITGNADDGAQGNFRPMTVMFPGGPSINGSSVQIDSTDGGHPILNPRTVWFKALGR